MAKLTGILPLSGSIENITFTKTKYGIIAKKKAGISKERIETEPNFQKTRENIGDFTTARKAASLVFRAFTPSLPHAKDSETSTRLMQLMKASLNLDTLHPRGFRSVTAGDLQLLHSFDFNIESALSSVLQAPFMPLVTRTTGDLTVTIPPFDIMTKVAAPRGATHMRIIATGAELDFANKGFAGSIHRSEYLPIVPGTTDPITLRMQVPQQSIHALFLSLGVEFFQDMNGQKYSLLNGKRNCHQLVKVDA
jgi:hypothetical protein